MNAMDPLLSHRWFRTADINTFDTWVMGYMPTGSEHLCIARRKGNSVQWFERSATGGANRLPHHKWPQLWRPVRAADLSHVPRHTATVLLPPRALAALPAQVEHEPADIQLFPVEVYNEPGQITEYEAFARSVHVIWTERVLFPDCPAEYSNPSMDWPDAYRQEAALIAQGLIEDPGKLVKFSAQDLQDIYLPAHLRKRGRFRWQPTPAAVSDYETRRVYRWRDCLDDKRIEVLFGIARFIPPTKTAERLGLSRQRISELTSDLKRKLWNRANERAAQD